MIVDLTVRVYYGSSIPNVVTGVRRNVAGRLLKLCGMLTKEVNIRVAGLEFPERMPGRVQ